MSAESLNPTEREVVSSPKQLSPRAIEMILNHQNPDGSYFDLEGKYRAATNLSYKYSVAVGLIEDGRYEDPLFLLKNFIPQGQPIDLDRQPVDPKEAKRLKEDLAYMLLQKGILDPKTGDSREAEGHLERELESDQRMKELALAGVPIEVLGQIEALEKFSNVTREEKFEEFRSWVTHSMLRWYLGTLAGEMPRRELTEIEIMDRIPTEIFRNPYAIRYNLIENYFEKRLMKHITDTGIESGLKTVEEIVSATEDPDRKGFTERVYNRLYDIATYPLKGDFKEKIIVKSQERYFPSFEQRAFAYDFVHHNTRLLAADTGLGKTSAAYLAMENSGAERVLVIPPANGRETWKIEEEVVFQDSGNTFVVNKSSDIEKALKANKKYVVIGQELLGRAEKDPKLFERLLVFVADAKIDGAIIDEIDNLSNPEAFSTKTALSLMSKIRENYNERTGSENAPVIGLTATPIRTGLSDMDIPMSILYPKEYASTPGEETQSRKTFSDTYLNNPHLTYIALTAEKRMFRWESASGVQELAYDPENSVRVEISPFEQLLYEFIGEEVETDALNKIRLLEDELLNPMLVKAEVRARANGKIPQIDIDETLGTIKSAVLRWRELRGVEEPESDDDYLSQDKLVELGFGDMVLGGFFSTLLEKGLDTLVDEFTEDTDDEDLKTLKKFWKHRGISSKYQRLKELVEQALEWRVNENGTVSRNKVMIISPTKRQGRTGEVEQRKINGEDLYAEYEREAVNDLMLIRLIKNWSESHCGEENVLMLDGTVPIGNKRNEVINRWVNNPDDVIMHANLKAVYQSRDFTINKIEDEYGRRIDGVTKIFLHWPWYWQQFKQMVGRSQRQGQLVPVETKVLEAQDMIDQGKGEVVRYTNLLQRIALSGGTLAPDDQEFFDSKRVGRRKVRFQNPEKRYLRDVFNRVRGRGEDEVQEFMNTVSSGQEKNNYQRFAERFYDEGRDEYRTSGYNAEMVASLMKDQGIQNGKIMSIGAGTLLLQRKLEVGIDNVDLNPYIMEAGWQAASEFGGRMITARASQLNKEEFPDSTYDAVDCSFTLHWSKLGNKVKDSERVIILSQMIRLLKPGGKLYLSFPEGAFDDESFRKFMGSVGSSFGLDIDNQYSGRSYGVSRLGSMKRLGWSIVGEKIRDVDLENLELSDLEFYNERNEWISPSGKNKDRPVVKSGEYPSPHEKLKFDRYEIVGLDDATTTISLAGGRIDQTDDANLPVVSTSEASEYDDSLNQPVLLYDAALSFLRGVTWDQYESYRKDLIRQLIKDAGMNWNEAEEFSINTYQSMVNKGQQPISRLRAYQLVLKEAKRLKGIN